MLHIVLQNLGQSQRHHSMTDMQTNVPDYVKAFYGKLFSGLLFCSLQSALADDVADFLKGTFAHLSLACLQHQFSANPHSGLVSSSLKILMIIFLNLLPSRPWLS